MKNAFIFHGTAGTPQENWFPWLKKELEQLGYAVFIPQFPTPEGQSLEAWLKILDDYKDKINNETIFIGHSLGGLFLLRVLEKLTSPVAGAFFVATSVGIKPILYYDADKAFCGFSFNWDKIKKNAQHIAVFHSDNDPYICLENGKEVAKQLGVKLNFIPNAGHFNTKSGYTKFDQLLEAIKKTD